MELYDYIPNIHMRNLCIDLAFHWIPLVGMVCLVVSLEWPNLPLIVFGRRKFLLLVGFSRFVVNFLLVSVPEHLGIVFFRWFCVSH